MSTTTKSTLLQFLLLSGWSFLITLLLTLNIAVEVHAHDSAFPFRYVAPHGIDRGDCDDPTAPCQTILYAINQAIPGDQVLVAAGVHFFDNLEAVLLLSEVIPVKGGYSADDAFAVQNPKKNPTYLVGLDLQYRDLVNARGFHLIQDAKEIELGLVTQDQPAKLVNTQQQPTTFTPCTAGGAGAYPCAGIDLLARISLDQFSLKPNAASDVWGYVDQDDQREYAIIGLKNGTAVVDVTDPLNPIEVGAIPGTPTIWRDIKVYQFYNSAQSRWDAYAYVTADNVEDGLQIIDLSGLPDNIALTNTYTGFLRAHNLYIGDVDYTTGLTQSGSAAHAYVLGSDLDGGSFRILDLDNPVAPVEVTAAPFGAGYVHDATTFVITDTRADDYCAMGHNPCELYIDFNENTVDIWDVTDKATPSQISSTPYPGSRYTHSGWWSDDKLFIFIQDELDELGFGYNTRLRVLDISDLTVPFISRVWEGSTKAIDHNGFVQRTHYYMSNYRRGLTVLDVSDPNNPAEIAFFDTFAANDSANFSGAWGVYPYLPSGTLLVSDIESGLFLLREQGLSIGKTGPSSVVAGQTIIYTLTITNNGTLPATNIVITDSIPAGAIYLSGGAQAGNVVSWTMDSLAPGQITQTTFAVFTTTNTLLTNSAYAARADGSVSALGSVRVTGEQAVVTVVGGIEIYLPLILKN